MPLIMVKRIPIIRITYHPNVHKHFPKFSKLRIKDFLNFIKWSILFQHGFTWCGILFLSLNSLGIFCWQVFKNYLRFSIFSIELEPEIFKLEKCWKPIRKSFDDSISFFGGIYGHSGPVQEHDENRKASAYAEPHKKVDAQRFYHKCRNYNWVYCDNFDHVVIQ